LLDTWTGEIEKYRKLLSTAREELEPWEKHIIECEGKIGVTSAASKLLKDKVSKKNTPNRLVRLQILLSLATLPLSYSLGALRMKTIVKVVQFKHKLIVQHSITGVYGIYVPAS